MMKSIELLRKLKLEVYDSDYDLTPFMFDQLLLLKLNKIGTSLKELRNLGFELKEIEILFYIGFEDAPIYDGFEALKVGYSVKEAKEIGYDDDSYGSSFKN